MSENLIKEYIERANRIREALDLKKDSDVNAILSVQIMLEKKIYELAMLMDLILSSKEEQYEEDIAMNYRNFDKNYQRASSWFVALKNKTLEGGEKK